MAYFLGFISADGCIKSPISNKESRYSLGIALSIVDIEILEKLKNEIKLNKDITKRSIKNNNKSYEICELIVHSKILVNDLISIGIKDLKSKDIEFPKIPKDYELDYIRGYFDGNGCISHDYITNKNSKNKITQIRIRINSGSHSILNSMQEILSSYGLKSKKVNKYGSFNYEICYSTSESLKIFDLFYKDDSLYLSRKYLKFKNAIETRNYELLNIKKYIKVKGEC